MGRTNYAHARNKGMTGMRFGMGLIGGLVLALILVFSMSVPIPGLALPGNGRSPTASTKEVATTSLIYTVVTGNASFVANGNGTTETLTAVASTTMQSSTTEGSHPASLDEVFGVPSSAQPAPSSVDSIAARPLQDNVLAFLPLVVALCAGGIVYLEGKRRRESPE